MVNFIYIVNFFGFFLSISRLFLDFTILYIFQARHYFCKAYLNIDFICFFSTCLIFVYILKKKVR